VNRDRFVSRRVRFDRPHARTVMTAEVYNVVAAIFGRKQGISTHAAVHQATEAAPHPRLMQA
jgi:hypothetical protein